jgi:hypothetical protein
MEHHSWYLFLTLKVSGKNSVPIFRPSEIEVPVTRIWSQPWCSLTFCLRICDWIINVTMELNAPSRMTGEKKQPWPILESYPDSLGEVLMCPAYWIDPGILRMRVRYVTAWPRPTRSRCNMCFCTGQYVWSSDVIVSLRNKPKSQKGY